MISIKERKKETVKIFHWRKPTTYGKIRLAGSKSKRELLSAYTNDQFALFWLKRNEFVC